MMASVLGESPMSPSSLSVPVETILSGQGAYSYAPMSTHPKISSGTSDFLRFGSLSLNPNAEEFVPSSLKVESTTGENFPSLMKSTIISLEPNKERRVSNDEYRQYVCSQLPDDILPDFNCPTEASTDCEQQHSSNVVDYRCSTSDTDQSRSFRNERGYVETAEQNLCQRSMKFSASLVEIANYTPYNSTNNGSYVFMPQQSASINQLSSQIAMRPALANDLKVGFYKDITNKSVLNDLGSSQSLNIRPSKFPNIAVESLADKFCSNGDDLGRTLHMLTQVELQEGTISRQSQLSAAAAPYMSVINIPSPSSFKMVNRHSQHHEDATIHPLHMDSHANFSNSGWQHNGRSGKGMLSGPLNPSHSSGEGSFILDSKVSSQERLRRNIVRELPRLGRQAWLEMGDAVAYTMEKRGKEPDHARMSNVYYEHAMQAHLAGKLALAKEFTAKGQWHSEQMKRESFKAGDIFGRKKSMVPGTRSRNLFRTTHSCLPFLSTGSYQGFQEPFRPKREGVLFPGMGLRSWTRTSTVPGLFIAVLMASFLFTHGTRFNVS